MTANDFQVLIAPVIGTVTVAAGAWIGLLLTLRRDKHRSRMQAARMAQEHQGASRSQVASLRKNVRPEAVAGS